MKNLKIAKFVVKKEQLKKVKGGTGGTGCVETKNSGCINGCYSGVTVGIQHF